MLHLRPLNASFLQLIISQQGNEINRSVRTMVQVSKWKYQYILVGDYKRLQRRRDHVGDFFNRMLIHLLIILLYYLRVLLCHLLFMFLLPFAVLSFLLLFFFLFHCRNKLGFMSVSISVWTKSFIASFAYRLSYKLSKNW